MRRLAPRLLFLAVLGGGLLPWSQFRRPRDLTLQLDLPAAMPGDLALHADLAAVRLDDALHDVEPQPESLLARARVLHVAHLVEPVEDLRDVRRRDAGAVVGHGDEHERGPRLRRDDDLPAVAAV